MTPAVESDKLRGIQPDWDTIAWVKFNIKPSDFQDIPACRHGEINSKFSSVLAWQTSATTVCACFLSGYPNKNKWNQLLQSWMQNFWSHNADLVLFESLQLGDHSASSFELSTRTLQGIRVCLDSKTRGSHTMCLLILCILFTQTAFENLFEPFPPPPEQTQVERKWSFSQSDSNCLK